MCCDKYNRDRGRSFCFTISRLVPQAAHTHTHTRFILQQMVHVVPKRVQDTSALFFDSSITDPLPARFLSCVLYVVRPRWSSLSSTSTYIYVNFGRVWGAVVYVREVKHTPSLSISSVVPLLSSGGGACLILLLPPFTTCCMHCRGSRRPCHLSNQQQFTARRRARDENETRRQQNIPVAPAAVPVYYHVLSCNVLVVGSLYYRSLENDVVYRQILPTVPRIQMKEVLLC